MLLYAINAGYTARFNNKGESMTFQHVISLISSAKYFWLTRFVCLLAGITTLQMVQAAEARPNVIIMLADDLGWADVGYHGGDIATPEIDRLAAEGVRLEKFYATPICSPTRAALMTARDPIKLGIAYDQVHPWYNAGLAADEYLISEAFHDAGYQTGLVGKWHLGHAQQQQLPNSQGFDTFYGHLHTNTDFYTHKREGGHDLQLNGVSVDGAGEYLTHIEAREAVRFIQTRKKDQPFFLYVPFTAPHSPMQAPAETIAKYQHLTRQNYRQIYAAMVDEMDQSIGQILSTLDAEGLTENTIVIFVSDNGGSNAFGGENQPLRGQKGQAFEGGIRVPAVIRWPAKLKSNTQLDQTVSVMDIYPTLLEAAAITVDAAKLPLNKTIDGQTMWQAIVANQKVVRNAPLFFVSEIPVPGMLSLAVIDGDWKLVQSIRESQTSMAVQSMLFNLAEDPYEKQDLASRQPAKLAALAELLRQRRSEHPLAGTRGTLVAHPGWVAPNDWSKAVVPAQLLQAEWKNELPFSRELRQAIGDRGVLISDQEMDEIEASRKVDKTNQ